VAILTPFQALDRSLSLRQDRIVLKGKAQISITVASASLPTGKNINPDFAAFLGSRVSTLSGLFSRYRILKLSFFSTAISATNDSLVIGVQDDDGTAAIIQPANYADVLVLRCSAPFNQIAGGQSCLMWSPVDPTKEYYTQTATGTAVPDRFNSVGTFWGAINGASPVTAVFVVFYTIEFSGATEPPGGS
jgi:hypothetical protein